jgi:PiT family inorganic phosphate transporter
MSVEERPAVETRPEWAALAQHRDRLGKTSLRALFAADPGRADTLTAEVDGLLMDYSKNLLDAEVVQALRGFRRAQIFSAAAMAFGHGLQDAQKTMGVIVLALVTYGSQTTFDVPLWVMLSAALAISLGTYSGGWRIMRTLGRRVIELDPPRGFAAETTAAGVLYTTAFVFAVPVSTTHTITSAIMGVGATRRLSAVRWGVARNIITAWVLTIPAAAIVAAVFYRLASLIVG